MKFIPILLILINCSFANEKKEIQKYSAAGFTSLQSYVTLTFKHKEKNYSKVPCKVWSIDKNQVTLNVFAEYMVVTLKGEQLKAARKSLDNYIAHVRESKLLNEFLKIPKREASFYDALNNGWFGSDKNSDTAKKVKAIVEKYAAKYHYLPYHKILESRKKDGNKLSNQNIFKISHIKNNGKWLGFSVGFDENALPQFHGVDSIYTGIGDRRLAIYIVIEKGEGVTCFSQIFDGSQARVFNISKYKLIKTGRTQKVSNSEREVYKVVRRKGNKEDKMQ